MQLFPYQEQAVSFLNNQRRAYLALDMGMGKTLTSLAAADRGGGNVLLVAEKNEIVNSQNFKREVETYLPHFTYYNLREESPLDGAGGSGDGAAVGGINPDGLVKLDDKLLSIFRTMIIDEATLAKTTTTQRFKRIHKIAKDMDYLSMLSGTPMMNGAAELYAPLLLMDHPMIAGKGASGRKAFEAIFAGGHYRKIRNTGKWFQDYTWWAKGANHVRELRYLLRDHFFILSKGETDVFKHKTRTVENVPMSLPWLGEYTQAWNDYYDEAKTRSVNLDNINELRSLIENGQMYQVNCRWLAKRMAQDIADGRYGKRRIIAFNIFIEADEVFQQELTRLGVSFRTFEDIQEWKAGDEQVLVGRMKAHGKGGNAPEASVTLIAGMDYVPANNIQAENRMDRPEQTQDMEVVYYLTEGDDVIDTHVRDINKDKARKVAEFMRPLTDEELEDMPRKLAAIRLKYRKDAALLGI